MTISPAPKLNSELHNQSNSEPDSDTWSDMSVLLVEDDEIMRLSLGDRLRLEGIPVRLAETVAAARRELEHNTVDMVITDIRLPDGSGADLFHEVIRRFPGLPVLIMTAYGEISDAVALVKSGAVDYLTKPFELGNFIAKVRHTLSRTADVRLPAGLGGFDVPSFHPGSGFLGKSPVMRRMERLIARLSEVDSTVLITGESGVGKEVVATLLHHNSLRRNNPLVRVNCAALPASLIESELFGHEKGAFTGAAARRIGRFEQAHSGTIFLDEIAEIPPESQVKLLRVLQEREIERVGSGQPVAVNVRVVAATQVDLDTALKEGRFRNDLYWRLNVIHVDIPPLRERPEDILYLSRQFVQQHASAMGRSGVELSADAEAELLSMPFPGNVRELKNLLERAVALCEGPCLLPQDLLPLDEYGNDPGDADEPQTLRASVAAAESRAILEALIRSGWIIGQAAEALGISRKNLWEKMKRYGLEKSE